MENAQQREDSSRPVALAIFVPIFLLASLLPPLPFSMSFLFLAPQHHLLGKAIPINMHQQNQQTKYASVLSPGNLWQRYSMTPIMALISTQLRKDKDLKKNLRFF